MIGWSGQVIVRGGSTRRSAPRSRSTARLEVSGSGRAVRIDAGRSRGRDDSTLELDVPAGTALLLRTQSGDVDVRGTEADVEVYTTTGDVRVANAARVRIDNVAGDVTGERHQPTGCASAPRSGDLDLGARGR